MGGDLGCNNIHKHGEQAVCKVTYIAKIKGSERRPFFFFFRLNIVLYNSYQVDQTVMDIEQGKYEKFKGTMSKAFEEFY